MQNILFMRFVKWFEMMVLIFIAKLYASKCFLQNQPLYVTLANNCTYKNVCYKNSQRSTKLRSGTMTFLTCVR